MVMKTKVRKIGNSFGIILPKEARAIMKVKEGDVLYLTEAPEESVKVSPDRAGFEAKQRIAQDLINRYRNALRELAK